MAKLSTSTSTASLKNNSIRLLNDSTVGFLSEYQVLKGNEDNQANSEELKNFLTKGWVSDLQNKQTKEITLNTLITRLEGIQTPQKFRKTDFISKNYFGSIQNNNLPANSIWETWFPGDILLFCSGCRYELYIAHCRCPTESFLLQQPRL